jgi:cytidine deaminase
MPLSHEQLLALTQSAKAASKLAYCPYSRFPVGAAVLTDDGTVVSGCNVENASFGLTICAERNAIFRAVGEGRRKVLAVVVYTPTPGPTAPCGACRQVIHEFGPGAEVVGVCDGPDMLRARLDELLPHAFGPESL